MLWKDIETDRHYSGTFTLCDMPLQGQIIYNKYRGIILLDVKIKESDENVTASAIDMVDIIPGILDTGSHVLLNNCRCIRDHTEYGHFREFQYICKQLVWGIKHKDNLLFNRFNVIVSNALKWSELSPFEKTKDFSLKVKEFGIVESKEFEWFEAKIRFSPYLENSLLSTREEDIEINQRLEIEIDSEDKRDIQYYLSIRDKIISMISFAIRDNVNIEEQKLSDYDDYYNFSDGTKDYYRYELFTSEPVLRLNHTNWWDYNFTLPQLGDSNCNNNLEKLSPIFNLYLSLYKYEYMPSEMVFLNIIQAVETFHARFVFDDLKKYINYVDKNHVLYSNLRVSDQQRKANHILLSSRIYDLLVRTNIHEFQRYYLDKELNFVQSVTDTRHYFTHYGKNKEGKALSGQALNDAIFILSTLLEFHVCNVLGIDNKASIQQALKQRHNREQDKGSMKMI